MCELVICLRMLVHSFEDGHMSTIYGVIELTEKGVVRVALVIEKNGMYLKQVSVHAEQKSEQNRTAVAASAIIVSGNSSSLDASGKDDLNEKDSCVLGLRKPGRNEDIISTIAGCRNGSLRLYDF